MLQEKRCVTFRKKTPMQNCSSFLYRFARGRNISEFVTESCWSVVDCSLANWCSKARLVVADLGEFLKRKFVVIKKFVHSFTPDCHWEKTSQRASRKIASSGRQSKKVLWKIFLQITEKIEQVEKSEKLLPLVLHWIFCLPSFVFFWSQFSIGTKVDEFFKPDSCQQTE